MQDTVQQQDAPRRNESVLEGVWQIVLTVVASTGITKVDLPYLNREMPIRGTKEARESFCKLLAGFHRDLNPLHFRSEYYKNTSSKDPYYEHAPGWTTLSGGDTPGITCSPVKISEDCVAVAPRVPYVKNEVKIMILENDGTKKPVTIDELRARNIQLKPVPRLAPEAQGSSSEVIALRAKVAEQDQRMSELQAQVAALMAAKTAHAENDEDMDEAPGTSQRSQRVRRRI